LAGRRAIQTRYLLNQFERLAEACEEFAAADRLEPLAVDDLGAFAEAAQVLGRAREAIRLLRRAYEARVEADEIESAVTSAFWLWQVLIVPPRTRSIVAKSIWLRSLPPSGVEH
jgi:hypothetical protein